ncbi:hypothetical protein CW304_21265 [Bacillus sp. UFRGS-B20]|nr:hypothetical protein CW304_21265 [Bacillus sp. UFRGS-B20]
MMDKLKFYRWSFAKSASPFFKMHFLLQVSKYVVPLFVCWLQNERSLFYTWALVYILFTQP